MIVCANQQPFEGTVTTEEIKEFNLKIRKIVIINDSASENLQFKFNGTETYATLYPGETYSADVFSKTVYIKSESGTTSALYRIWGLG